MCYFSTDNESECIYKNGLFNDVISIIDIIWLKMKTEDKNAE
jgi:hypothetical protein